MTFRGRLTEDKGQPRPAVGRPNVNEITENEIDHNLMGTFPASDPPSWTLGVDRDKQSPGESQKES